MSVKNITVNTPWGMVENGMRFPKLTPTQAKPVTDVLKATFKKCGHCGADGTVRCLGCEQHYYCNAICQSADWGHHKVFCKSTSKGRRKRPFLFLASFLGYRAGNPEFRSFELFTQYKNVLETKHCLWVVTSTEEYYEMRPQSIEVWNTLVKSFGAKWGKAQVKMLQTMPCFRRSGTSLKCVLNV